jgi:hypothetical protein
MDDDRPTDQELDRLQWTTVLYDLHETKPRKRAGPGQDRPGRPQQHRRRRPGPSQPAGDRRARRGLPTVRGELARRRSGSCTTYRRGRSRTPPVTRASSTTSSTSRPGGGSGSASCPRSIRHSCSRACLPPPTSMATPTTRPKSVGSPTCSTACVIDPGASGSGPKLALEDEPPCSTPTPPHPGP